MYTFEITWESGNKTELVGNTLEDAIGKAGYNRCVKDKIVFYKKIKKESINSLLKKQNEYIRNPDELRGWGY